MAIDNHTVFPPWFIDNFVSRLSKPNKAILLLYPSMIIYSRSSGISWENTGIIGGLLSTNVAIIDSRSLAVKTSNKPKGNKASFGIQNSK